MNGSHSRRLLDQIVFPFVAYVLLFVGMGLVAGSVVHFGEVSQIHRFATIGMVGMVLFALGSYLQEKHINPQKLKQSEILIYVLYSLLLAVGIGMMSGGTQHFLDFPRYASFLLPAGLLLALLAYVLRHREPLSRRAWNSLIVGAIAVALPLFLGLNHYAQSLPPTEAMANHHGLGQSALAQTGHADSNAQANEQVNGHSGEGHMMSVGSDIDFLTQMIPHHQEAVDTSAYLLTRTANPELQTFLRSVIQVQSQEVDQMRQWYQQWTSKSYQPDDQYQPMMANLPRTEGTDLERAYLQGMIAHHQGAIAMAQQVQSFTQRPELQTMAEAIIQTQGQEVEQLQAWLDNPRK